MHDVLKCSSSPQLASAYSVAGSGQEPEFTSWKFREAGESLYTIDYVWYTSDKLAVTGVWGLPSHEEIRITGLPVMRYPSDHMALGV